MLARFTAQPSTSSPARSSSTNVNGADVECLPPMRASWDARAFPHVSRDTDHHHVCSRPHRIFVRRTFLTATAIGRCDVVLHYIANGSLHATLMVAVTPSVIPIPVAAGAGYRRRAAARQRVPARRLAPFGVAPPPAAAITAPPTRAAAPPASLAAAPLEECYEIPRATPSGAPQACICHFGCAALLRRVRTPCPSSGKLFFACPGWHRSILRAHTEGWARKPPRNREGPLEAYTLPARRPRPLPLTLPPEAPLSPLRMSRHRDYDISF
eukprot:gene244-biopygen11579